MSKKSTNELRRHHPSHWPCSVVLFNSRELLETVLYHPKSQLLAQQLENIYFTSFLRVKSVLAKPLFIMAQGGFFKNRRVYILATVAYMGSLLFGKITLPTLDSEKDLILIILGRL